MTTSAVHFHRWGRGFYSWSNGENVLSDRYLSANVCRDSDNPHRWVIRYFVESENAHVEFDIWSLRMARGILARVAKTYHPPVGASVMHRSSLVAYMSFQGWKVAAEEEIALIGVGA